MTRRVGAGLAAGVGAVLAALAPHAQTQPPGGGKGGFGFGPPGGQERKLVQQFDKNGDGWLNAGERVAAREEAKKGGGKGKGFGPGGGFGGKGGGREAPKPGPAVTPAQVKNYPPGVPFYDPAVLRTLFLEFENKDWEAELQDFHGTDVDVPATLTVDGTVYRNVGVHFRGMSSYMGVPAGSKRSLNLAVDMADKKQRVGGYKTLNLLNSHDDPSMMSSVLYSHVARQYTAAPKANFVKVVVNGESWGVYGNLQQFNKEFLAENYKTEKGARWKVRGSPGGRGGLEYFGDNPDDYKRVFQIKSGDDPKAWQALVKLCKTLNQTPADKLEAALAPMLDLDGLLWFLALDVALINNDGYWVRASDYSLYLDPKGKFHVVPHDMNEAFRGGMGGPGGGMMMFRFPQPGELLPPPLVDALQLTEDQKKELAALQKEAAEKLDKVLTGEQRKQLKDMRDRGPGGFGPPGFGGPPGGPGAGPGGPGGPPGGPGGPGGGFGGPRGGGVTLDPLVGLNDATKPLRSKILAVQALRAKYLANVKAIAEKSLDWKTLGPVVAQFRTLIEAEVDADTRKLDSAEAFRRTTADAAEGGGGGRGMSLRAFADQRRKFLLDYTEPKPAAKP